MLRKVVLIIMLVALASASTDEADALDIESIRLDSDEDTRYAFDVRGFTLFTNPYAGFPAGSEPQGLQSLTLRFKLDHAFSEHLSSEVHGVLDTLLTSEGASSQLGAFTLVNGQQLFTIDDLQVEIVDSDDALITLRPDRFALRYEQGPLVISAGRQAVSFGKTFFWNPIDWLSPFQQNTLDRSYKPGVDALELNLYSVSGSSWTLVYAAGDEMRWSESALLGRIGQIIHSWEFSLIGGKVASDERIGFGFAATPSWMGGAALRGEWAVYFTPATSKDFQRASVGFDMQWLIDLRMVAEYHYNGFGVLDPSGYAALTAEPHFQRFEITNLGVHYIGVDLDYELLPTLQLRAATTANLVDGSLVVVPSLNYGIHNDLDLRAGAFLPIGARPSGTTFRSEFGFYPQNFWVQFIFVK